MANKIQLRRDTTANWTSSNPTLSQGEIGYELNTGKIKIGTGTTAWNSLSYLTIATSSVTGTLTFPDNTVQSTAWLGSLAYSSLTGLPSLATVATSGSYNDLSNKPNIAGTYSFNVAADDSTVRAINSNETVKFIGAGSVTTSSDTEGNITITGASTTPSWGDITNKTGSSGPYSVALGLNAGAGANSISLGQLAGSSSQGTNAVAIGNQSGAYSQGGSTVSIGSNAGYTGQGNFAIAIGASAGQTNQGVRAIAIGFAAGDTNQATGSIILNATDVSVNSAGAGFHVAPVRQSLGVAVPIAQYNTSTKELTYSDISINGNTITTTDSNVDLRLDANGEGAVDFGSIKIKRNNIIGVNSNEDIVIDPSGEGAVDFGSIKIKQNNIFGVNSNEDIVIDPSGTGGVIVNGNLTATVAEATTASTARSVGYLGIPASTVTTTNTLTIADAGEHIYVTTNSQTITIPANASVAYPIGTTLTFIAGPSATTVTIAITSDTLRLAGGTSTGTRTLAANGMATAVKVAATTWYINGTGLT